jgi:O-antigen ligase
MPASSAVVRKHFMAGRAAGGIARVELSLSVALGAAVPLTGFTPLNHADEVVGIIDRPGLIVAVPSILVVLVALACSVGLPARERRRVPAGIAAGGLLLVAAAAISVTGSADPRRSLLLMVLSVCAPALLFVALLRSRLSPAALLGGCLAALALLLLRADVAFFHDWGLPSTADLQAAKYQNVAYDFHYYSLGNPDHTAGYCLMPLVAAAYWCAGRRLPRPARLALAVAAAVIMLTLVLTYARFAIATAIAMLALLAAVLPGRRRIRAVALAVVAAGAVLFVASTASYLAQLASTRSDASVPERVTSLKDGFAALAEHPLTGAGLGQYSEALGRLPAHSSVVQAGAEMGVLGFAALLLLTAALVAHAARVIRSAGWFDRRAAAALAVAVYAVASAIAAPSDLALIVEFVPVWALTAALLLAVSLMAPERTLRESPLKPGVA